MINLDKKERADNKALNRWYSGFYFLGIVCAFASIIKGNDTVLFLSGIVVGASGFGMTITSIE
jgi:hypothetical protein